MLPLTSGQIAYYPAVSNSCELYISLTLIHPEQFAPAISILYQRLVQNDQR